MKTIAIINHKGGVGKTMTAHNLAFALAAQQKNVALVDFDPQHNLTTRTVAPTRLAEELLTKPTIEQYVYDDTLPLQPIDLRAAGHFPTNRGQLLLIPGSSALAECSLDMARTADTHEATTQLSLLLQRITAQHPTLDYCLIDCEPGSSMLMLNALMAADEFIIPISDADSIQGVATIGRQLANNGRLGSVRVKYLLTMVDSRKRIDRAIRSALIAQCPEMLLHTYIRKCEDLRVAANNSLAIFDHRPTCPGAEDYADLATELLAAGRPLGATQP